MTKAKLRQGSRVTKVQQSRKKRKKEDGRPRGTLKRFPFEETRLGFFLKYEVPVVHDVIMKMTPPDALPEPPLLLVRIVCRASSDPSLKKARFRRYMEEYAECGLCCKRGKHLTEERKTYYEGIRKKKLEKFIRENKGRIEGLQERV